VPTGSRSSAQSRGRGASRYLPWRCTGSPTASWVLSFSVSLANNSAYNNLARFIRVIPLLIPTAYSSIRFPIHRFPGSLLSRRMISRSCAWRAPLLAVIWLAVLGMCMWWGHACGWRALKPVPATCDARPDRPRLPAASAADGAGHADNAGQPAPGPGPAKPRPGKRERARMRVHAKQYPGRRLRPDGAGLAAASADVGEQSTRALQQQPKLREGRRARNDGEPTPHAPAILEAMESTSAADAFRKILLDPETGLPDDAELTEIYMRYERGLPLSTRQQVWLDATSDVGSRPHIVLNQSQCSAPPRPSSSAPITPPPFYYRPILGCGDFANCADCRYRYNLPANYTPPPAETRPQNASEFLRRFFEGGKLLVEELRRMKRERGNESILELISDDPPVEHACGFHDLMRAADPAALPDDDNTTMSEQEALTTIYSRLATSQAVSDFNMRRALQVTSPHCRPWSLSRQGLVDEITRCAASARKLLLLLLPLPLPSIPSPPSTFLILPLLFLVAAAPSSSGGPVE